MTALDRRATITPEHQARLDGLADALTETVYQRIFSDSAAVDRLIERMLQHPDLIDSFIGAINHRQRGKALRVREAKLADLRAHEELFDLPRSVPTRREAA